MPTYWYAKSLINSLKNKFIAPLKPEVHQACALSGAKALFHVYRRLMIMIKPKVKDLLGDHPHNPFNNKNVPRFYLL